MDLHAQTFILAVDNIDGDISVGIAIKVYHSDHAARKEQDTQLTCFILRKYLVNVTV